MADGKGCQLARWDAVLYGLAAGLAAASARLDHIPLQREWARLAQWPYAAAAVVAAALALLWRARPTRRPLAARGALAVVVLLAVLVVPLVLELTWRAREGDRLHLQSEIFLTEEGARALLRGHDPYSVSYDYGLLRTYPAGVWRHIPYLPGIFAFGMARILLGPGPLTDARIGFTLVSLAATLLALRWSGVSGGRRLLILMVLLVLPTGARYLVGGGDDVAVLALLLLAVVLEQRRRPVVAGVVAGLAAVVKQTAWLALPFLALAAVDRDGRRAGWRYLAAVGAIVVPVVGPFAVWDTGGLVRSTVLFPLGLTGDPTIARGLTVGQLLAGPFPRGKGAVAVLLAAAVVSCGVLLAVKRPPDGAAMAAGHAAVLLAIAVALAPAGRLGYLIYPLNLGIWSWLLGSGACPIIRQPGRARRRTTQGTEEEAVLALIARYRTQPGQGDTVEALLREMMAAVGRDEPDCLLYRVTRSPRDGDSFLLYEEYVDEGALDAHRRTPHFRDLIEGKVIPLLVEREREVMVPIA